MREIPCSLNDTFSLGCGDGIYDVQPRVIWGIRYGVRAQRCSYVTCIGVPVVFPVLCLWNLAPVDSGYGGYLTGWLTLGSRFFRY